MVVLILERVSPGLRGELTRWMLELHPGVFVGSLSALVRERIWSNVTRKVRDGAAILLYTAPGEQGFAIQSFGAASRAIEDFDGLLLVRTRQD